MGTRRFFVTCVTGGGALFSPPLEIDFLLSKCAFFGPEVKFGNTVRPRGTRPHGTQTSLGHDFKKGSKFLAGHDFGS